jgi:hypothetical protein
LAVSDDDRNGAQGPFRGAQRLQDSSHIACVPIVRITDALELKEQQQKRDERTIPYASMNLPESLSAVSTSVWTYAQKANGSFSQAGPVRLP